MAKQHLIGAYGLFWDRDAVNWEPGSGPDAWQLLGRRGLNKGTIRVCDFRRAQGFYILFGDYGATYVGLARGRGGIGERLKQHHKNRHEWTRFCWFSFDSVYDANLEGWSVIERRRSLNASSETMLRECEALLIKVLGAQGQNQMRFIEGEGWEQLVPADYLPGGLADRVDGYGFTDPYALLDDD